LGRGWSDHLAAVSLPQNRGCSICQIIGSGPSGSGFLCSIVFKGRGIRYLTVDGQLGKLNHEDHLHIKNSIQDVHFWNDLNDLRKALAPIAQAVMVKSFFI
jgi:hypothetical protein